jgi:hypothetical protein
MNREKFFKVMMALAGNFGTAIQPATLDVWFAMAKDDWITYEQISAAAQTIMRTKTDGYGRMPTYAELLVAIRGQAPTIEHKATAEANRVIAHLHTYGATTSPDLSADPITQRLMTVRWHYKTWASQVLESELKWWVKEFVQAYEAEQISSGRHAQIPAKLRGLIENIGGGKEGFNNSLSVRL